MRTLSKLILFSFLSFGLLALSHQDSYAQLGKLKNKLKKKVNSTKNKTSNTGSTTGKSSAQTQQDKSTRLNREIGEEKTAQLLAFYRTMGQAAEIFPPASNLKDGLYIDYCDKKSTYLVAMETLDWPNLSKKIAEDKSKYPDLFKYYGMEAQGRYADLEYGGNTNNANPKPFSGDLNSVNINIKKIYEWRANILASQKGMAMTVQNLINKAEQAQEAKKFDCSLNAVKMAKAIRDMDPDNPMIEDMVKDAQIAYDRRLTQINHLMTGDFHRAHIKDIVLFNSKPSIGSENAANATKEINVGEPTYLVGYFASDNKSGGGVASLGWTMVDEQTSAEKAMTKYAADYYQTIYQHNSEIKNKLLKQSHMVFELFPDPASLNYKSHFQYIPHLNFAKWVTMQMPGTYQMVFRWGKSNIMASSGVITMNITREGREKAKAYYQELMKKKVATVTFPGGCNDQVAKVVNASDLSKYGKLLKVTMSTTGDIMFPWPNDDKVEWNTANGYGAFQTKDGKYEVINLEFRKKPTDRVWKWWSIGKTPSDYELIGKTNIKPEALNFGYEMTQSKVNTCEDW